MNRSVVEHLPSMLRTNQAFQTRLRHLPNNWLAKSYLSMSETPSKKMKSSLPSSLSCDPIKLLSKPEDCQFFGSEQFVPVPMVERIPVSPTSFVLRFELPDKTKSMQLSTCSCILASATVNGENVIRPYTPISTNEQIGTFDLLVKRYDNGVLSKFMCDDASLEKTDVSFKQIPFNIKLDASEFVESSHILMLAGGTGITPMIQALHAILGQQNGGTKVTLVYGSQSEDDILAQALLDKWADKYSEKLSVIHILSHSKADSESSTKYRHGFITKSLLEEVVPCKPSEISYAMVCGPPPMYDALCGPRTETDKISGVLAEMGFTPSQVYKF